MTTLADAVPQEIKRVRDIQDQYKTLRGMPNVIVEPQIAMMEAAIERATKALPGGDVIELLAAYENLKGFEA